jgi:hypothetical protein
MGDFEKSLQNLDTNLIYEQISKIEVPLEMQSTYNRHYIDQKIVECDKALDLLDKINTKVVRELTNYEIRQSIVEEEINNKKRNEFANNQDLLKKYATGKERESAIELLMKDSMAEFNKLSRKILSLRSLSGLIKTKQSIIIKKMRNIQDQSRMMSDLIKINVPLPDDKDTAKLMKALGGVEALERSLEAEEGKEFIEQEEDVTVDNKDTDTDITLESDPVPSDVTQQEPKVSTSTEVDTSDLDLGNTDSKGSSAIEPDSVSSEEESQTSDGENPEGGEDSDLDMDTVLDGLDNISEGDAPMDIDSGPTNVASTADAEIEADTDVSSDGNTSIDIDQGSSTEVIGESSAGTILEDILSEDVPVVTNKPAKKSGQGEPSSKDKSPKIAPKEDTATIPGDVNIDNILDDLSNF